MIDMQAAAAVSYPVLTAVVLLGSVVPVLPTGAAVSAAAALAVSQGGLALVLVVLLAAAAAFAGDCVIFALCRRGGPRVLRLVGRGAAHDVLDEARDRLMRNGGQVLVLSRLVPAGRIPVLLAAGAIDYPWARFLMTGSLAAAVWAVLYAALGIIGGGIFASPLPAVLAAVLLVVLVSLASRWVQRRHAARVAST